MIFLIRLSARIAFFKSKVLDTHDKFSFVFTKAGTYPYSVPCIPR